MPRQALTSLLVGLCACGSDGGGAGAGAADAQVASRDAGPDARPPLFVEKPECSGQTLTALSGQHPMVISKLAIGTQTDGFDLDHDGNRDNKLAGLGPIAMSSIENAFTRMDFVVPLEMADFPTLAADDCVKVGFYLGKYKLDNDHDGKLTAVAGGDCNDNDLAIKPGAAEVPGNGKDDNCDGRADEDGPDTMDRDHDGRSTMAGDCDDTRPEVGAANAVEICGDGLDNDCDGVADSPGCNPYDDTPDSIAVDASSITGTRPTVLFKSARTVAAGGGFQLQAGPAFFTVSVPVTNGLALDLRISGTQLEADVVMKSGGLGLMRGRLGGVLDASTLDQIRGLEVSQIGLTKDDSLLDVIFASFLGTALALPRGPSGCLTPDIDVDGDGLEAFCAGMTSDGKLRVDRCIDGDGTEIRDTPTTQCTEAKKPDGTLRFVDGISVALTLEAVPAARLYLAP